MRIELVRVHGYRALLDTMVPLDQLTVFIGANSTGKSSFLNALQFFFEGIVPTQEDVHWDADPKAISVDITFGDLSHADRAALGRFITGDQLVVSRRWEPSSGMRAIGRGRRFDGFASFWDAADGNLKRSAYATLRKEYDLASASNVANQTATLLAWQREHDDLCVDAEVDASELFGTTGEGTLASRFRYVPVPAQRDAGAEAREGRNTLVTRLLAGIRDRRLDLETAIEELRTRAQAEYDALVESMQSGALEELADQFGARLRAYVPSAAVQLVSVPAEIAVDNPGVQLRGGERDELTDLMRQGHGFGRVFLIAGLQLLSEMDMPREDPPALFLTIEEPELFQHPTRARFVARVLDRLAAREHARVQVCYATHSPYFIDPARYERLRLFGRDQHGRRRVTIASHAAVASRLSGVVPPEQIQRRLERTLDGSFNEGFFARAVILTEGRTESLGALRGTADLLGIDLDASGIAVIAGGGKTGLPVRLAVLDTLGIPSFVVFDGDAHREKDRLQNGRENAALLRSMGLANPAEFPPDSAGERYVCFENDLEAYLRGLEPAFDRRCEEEAGSAEWRIKSDPVYRAVVGKFTAPPPLLAEVIRRAAEAARAEADAPAT